MTALWIPLAVFAGVGLTILLIGQLLIGLRRGETTRRQLVFGPLTGFLASLVPASSSLREALDRELKQAGFYEPRSVDQFLSIRNTLIVGWMLLTGAAAYVANEFHPELLLPTMVVGLVVLLLAYGVPRLWLQSVAAKRVQRIQNALPDALDLITMCLTGGLPLQPALERVGKEVGAVHPDLGMELEIIRRQADAHTLDHALTQFANRIDVPEINSLAALVSQTERLGTNVATALRDYADSIRRSFRQRAEEKGNKNSVKLLLPVALCLAPPVYILLLAPAVLELRDFIIRENRPGGVLAPNNESIETLMRSPTPADPATRPGAGAGYAD